MPHPRRWSSFARGALLVICLSWSASAQLVVVPGADASTVTARQLAGQVAPGVPILSATLTGASAAAGTFSGGTSVGLELAQGIVLSSGRVADVVGPNDSDAMSTDWELPGNDTLSQLLSTPQSSVATVDAAVLSFTFSCPSGARGVRVEFAFGSEEYEGFDDPADLAAYDGAAILIDGVNAATLPGGVALTAPTLATSAAALFNDNNACNVSEELSCPHNLQADGFSKRLIGQVAINPALTTHQATLMVADDFFGDLDSWLFVRSLSCTADPQSAQAVPGLGLSAAGWLAAGLLLTGGLLRRRAASAAKAAMAAR